MSLADLKYAKTHEWVSVDGEMATLGISAFAVEQLTDLVFIDLPGVGQTITAGEVFGEVESVKAASDLYSPISGEITEVNSSLADDLALLSEDPFGRGWMVKLKLSNPDELNGLLDADAYKHHCESEAH
jgi:glycine cleavage system H protein